MSDKPYAPACDRNAEPIYQILQQELSVESHILEIGSGTGQHAVAFCAQQARWRWQCSDRPEQIPGIKAWLEALAPQQAPEPLALDVLQGPWPTQTFDAVFTANTLHIMPWQATQMLFEKLPALLPEHGKLLVYGPFNYNGQFTSESNAQFELWLKQGGAHQGIRDFEAVAKLADQAGLELRQDYAMPANNRLLCWRRRA